jgi:hypothetical protein
VVSSSAYPYAFEHYEIIVPDFASMQRGKKGGNRPACGAAAGPKYNGIGLALLELDWRNLEWPRATSS